MIPMALTNLKELELFIIFRAIAVCDAPQLVKQRKQRGGAWWRNARGNGTQYVLKNPEIPMI